MKITIIADVLGSENNGTTITTKRLIENLKQRGHQVNVACPSKIDECGYFFLQPRNFGIFNKYIQNKNGVQLASPDKKVLEQAIEHSDLVHIILPYKAGRAGLKIAKSKNIAVTAGYHFQPENFTSHIGLKNCKLANNFIYRHFYNNFYKYVDIVHCPSNFIAKEIKKHGFTMDIRVISNGIHPVYRKMDNVQKPSNLQDKFCILFIGRFSKEKRHDILVNAVNLSKYRDKIQLIFAGDGPTKKAVVKQGWALPNPPVIDFFAKEELVKTINYCDLYVHPSDIEIEAIACLEAITCGLVPIISDSKRSATNAFALSNKNLFKNGNPKDLAQKIDFMIENPQIVQEIKQQYLDYAVQFQISKCIDKMEQMFFDAVKNKNVKPNLSE